MKIGVTGTVGAGKDTVAEYLMSKGFEHISLSNFIREELRKRNLHVTRENLWKVGNGLRRKKGSTVLAKRAIATMAKNKNYVITSIRNPAEAKVLLDSGNFVLLGVDAPIELRFKRVKERKGRNEKDARTFEEFKKAEKKEMESENKTNQQIKKCLDMAQFILINDSDKASFFKKMDNLMPKILRTAFQKQNSLNQDKTAKRL